MNDTPDIPERPDPDKRLPKPTPPKPSAPKIRIFGMGGGEPPEEVKRMLEGLMGGEGEDHRPCTCSRCRPHIDSAPPTEDLVKSLRSMSEAMDRPINYGVGDIVRYKPGLNHSRVTNLAIVRKIYSDDEAPIAGDDQNGHGHGSPLWREKLNVILGILVNEGQFFEYHVDGRRIEKASDDDLAETTTVLGSFEDQLQSIFKSPSSRGNGKQ